MAQEKYGVRLKTEERNRLQQVIRSGRGSARAMARARILLKMDEARTAPRTAEALEVSQRTVFRIKRRHAEEGLEEVLRHCT